MLTIKAGASFKKDYKRLKKRHYNLDTLAAVIDLLATGNPLPEKYKDHILISDYAGWHECHIAWSTR